MTIYLLLMSFIFAKVSSLREGSIYGIFRENDLRANDLNVVVVYIFLRQKTR